MESELVQAINSITERINALAQPRFIDWLAVILSFFSVVLSGTAIWFAVQVPKKIADRQDKIALFEKRYHLYYLFMKCVHTIDRISEESTCFEDFAHVFDYYFNIRVSCEDNMQREKMLVTERANVIRNLSEEFDKMCILFPIEEEYLHEVQKLLANLLFVINFPNVGNARDKTISILNDLRKKGILDIMRRELKIF